MSTHLFEFLGRRILQNIISMDPSFCRTPWIPNNWWSYRAYDVIVSRSQLVSARCRHNQLDASSAPCVCPCYLSRMLPSVCKLIWKTPYVPCVTALLLSQASSHLDSYVISIVMNFFAGDHTTMSGLRVVCTTA